MGDRWLNSNGLSYLIDKLKASIAKKVDKEEFEDVQEQIDTLKEQIEGLEKAVGFSANESDM